MSRMIEVVLILCVVLFLAGCDGDVTADLYVQDILEAAEGEVLYTKATLVFESPGESGADLAEQIVRTFFRNAGNFRTQQRDMFDYTAADFELPVVRLADYVPGEDILTLVVEPFDGGIAFGLAFNQQRFKELSDIVQEEFWQALSAKDFMLMLDLSNDLRENVVVAVEGVYVNQKPILYTAEFTLARREGLDIRLSDVMHDYLYEHLVVEIGELRY